MKNKKPDFNDAHNAFSDKNKIVSYSFFDYSPAYIMTNEDLRDIMNVKNPNGLNVLTAAGSGDHPIFYKLFGAKNVDTFDISFCAKTIMDIKTSAISVLDYDNYIYMLDDLYNAPEFSKILNFQKVQKKFPPITKNFIQEIKDYDIFCNGLNPMENAQFLPTKDEYEIIKKNINKPFNFIWSDISNLCASLAKKYDIIHLSNIFDYEKDAKKITEILKELSKNLSDNGIIIMHEYLEWISAETEKYDSVRDSVAHFGKLNRYKSQTQAARIFQKIK